MKTKSYYVALVFAVLGLLIQAFISWLWARTDAVNAFTSVFKGFHGYIPLWSRLAFSTAPYTWIALIICASLLAYGLVWHKSPKFITIVSVITWLIVVGLIYAMYPLPIKLGDRV